MISVISKASKPIKKHKKCKKVSLSEDKEELRGRPSKPAKKQVLRLSLASILQKPYKIMLFHESSLLQNLAFDFTFDGQPLYSIREDQVQALPDPPFNAQDLYLASFWSFMGLVLSQSGRYLIPEFRELLGLMLAGFFQEDFEEEAFVKRVSTDSKTACLLARIGLKEDLTVQVFEAFTSWKNCFERSVYTQKDDQIQSGLI